MQTFCSALLALCWAFSRGESRESLPMQSLRCYNDYKSQTTCTWQECRAARRFLNVTLHHKDNIKETSTPVPCEPQGAKGLPVCQDSCICWSCRRNSTSFAVVVKDHYSFKPDRLLQAKLNTSLFQNDTDKLLLHQMHWINVTKARNFLQAWKTAGGRKESDWLDNASELNVTYKGECPAGLRKNSPSVSVTSSSDSSGKCDALVPSSTYVAHAGSKPSQSSGWPGQSSERSPAVSQNSQEGDEAQPKKLRCLFNGVDQLTCSWAVRREVASSVLFTLFYRATPASQETECSPVHEEELPYSPYLCQSCEISVTNASSLSQYLVTVRPKEEEKLIAAYKNIKPLAPVNVTVTKVKDQEYELRWTKQALSFDHITQRYEFQYWKIGDSEENVRGVNISNDEPPIIFTLQMLEPSTHYRGKMRARVHESSSYKGPWSEWSEECTWETESVSSPLILPLLVPIFTILLIAFAWYGYIRLLRKKKKWEEKIPNPSKSQLLQSYLKKAPLGMGGIGKQSPSKKTDQASSIQVLEGSMKVSSAELPGAMDERMKCFLSVLDSENPYQTLEMTAPAPPSSALAGCHSSQTTSEPVTPATLPCRSSAGTPASQNPMSCFDFNGPYLHLAHGCSLPDIYQHSETAPFLTRGKLVSLEYVSLPKGSNSQTPLAGEVEGAAQLGPVSLPAQEERKQPPAGGQEVPRGQSAGGEAVQGDAEGQRSPTAATPNNSCQKWPMGYVTTEGLSLMPASDSAHLSPAQAPPEGMLSAVGVLMSSPCLPHATEHTPSPERAPKHPVAIQVPPPASANPEFGSYVMFPKAPHGTPEPSSVSSPILSEEVDFPKEESVQEGHVVMFNPDGTEPVFLRQVGEYCFFPDCKPDEKISVGEKSLLADQTSEAKQAFGKLPCDGESVSGKWEPALQMQAIQLFKTRKFDDYFALPS